MRDGKPQHGQTWPAMHKVGSESFRAGHGNIDAALDSRERSNSMPDVTYAEASAVEASVADPPSDVSVGNRHEAQVADSVSLSACTELTVVFIDCKGNHILQTAAP